MTLGRIWGFLKYYHPVITSGQRQWDYELFRVLPKILSAHDRDSANAVISDWIDRLGTVARCSQCGHLDKHDLQLSPDLGWIADTKLLGDKLSRKLQWIRDQRRVSTQYYVTLAHKARYPIFEHELPYSDVSFPDSGFQLLALYRFWNIIEYWYPNRDVIGEKWDQVLAAFIPKIALAKTRPAYELQMMKLIAKVHDTHAGLRTSLDLRPPVGECHMPVSIRFIQRQAVITKIDDPLLATSKLKTGDVIKELDDRPIRDLVREWAPYYSASNESARLRDIATYMTRGPCKAARLTISRGSQNATLSVLRVPLQKQNLAMGNYLPIAFHDLPGPAFRLLSPKVAYLKLSSASASQVADNIRKANGTEGLIIDARNYPSEFMVFALGSLLIDRPTPFARFTVGDLSNPGAFHWTPPQILQPKAPHYRGKVIILVDDVTQSQAEYTAMAFRAAPGALVVGSTTAGADGSGSRVLLPGGLFTLISGIGVFYPDKRPTQRIGIVPDVVVEPTVAATRAGRDLVLEEALRLILGPKPSTSTIEAMYQTRH
ncbi:MAG: hypothetical protein ABS82_02780 [Rhodanobacter sp. SCN 67-45]|nr:MAG: hypothetical protein ABS82_02780 [Rhodanobacter sp. SCN 67-45]